MPAMTAPSPFLTRPARRRPLVSLTPLIDVVFILLVFFMLASSFLDWRMLEVNVPAPGAAAAAAERPLRLALRPDGWYLDGAAVSRLDLQRRVAEHLAQRPDSAILVQPGAGVALQAAVDALEHLMAAGASRVALIPEAP